MTKMFQVETLEGESGLYTYNEMINANQDDADVVAFCAVANVGETEQFGGGAAVLTVVSRII